MSTPGRHEPHNPVHALVAVKELARAKTRLAADFGAGDRERLVLAMLTDTMHAAAEVHAIASITVVTPDDGVAALAHDLGAEVYPEPPATGASSDNMLNSALTHAAASIRRVRGPGPHRLPLRPRGGRPRDPVLGRRQ